LAYSINFGLLGSPTQWLLPGTDPDMLPVPAVDSPPVSGAITETVPLPTEPTLLFGGLVAASGHPDEDGGLLLDVTGAWNSVKNVALESENSGSVTLSGFVHTDIIMGGGGDSRIEIIGAKRGNIITSAGNDTILIRPALNEFSWVTEFRIATNAGDDRVIIDPLNMAEQAQVDVTFASTAHGAGTFRADDSDLVVFVDLGDGDDLFFAAGASRDRVSGGVGEDYIVGGRSDDILTGGADSDLFIFYAGDGTDIVTDFAPGIDQLFLVGFSRAEVDAALDGAADLGGSAYLSYAGGAIVLAGVTTSELSRSDFV
jgi:Ca2+-binding RTX toxin-like protein